MQRAARAQDTQDLAQRGDAQVGLEVVEHQRREHAVKAAVRVRELVGKAAIEFEREPGAPRLTAGAGERFGIGIQPDDLELRVRPLDQQREVACPAADLQHPLGRFKLGLIGELAVRGLNSDQARKRVIQRQQPIAPHAREEASTGSLDASDRLG